MLDLEKIRSITGDYHEFHINFLKDKKNAAAYLKAAVTEYQQDNNTEAFLLALRYVAEAQGGISHLAEETKLNRESLYKTLSSKGNPKLATIGAILKGLGFELSIKPIKAAPAHIKQWGIFKGEKCNSSP